MREQTANTREQIAETIEQCYNVTATHRRLQSDFNARLGKLISKENERLGRMDTIKEEDRKYSTITDILYTGRKREMPGFKEAYARQMSRFTPHSQTARSLNKSPQSLQKKARELQEHNQSPDGNDGQKSIESSYQNPDQSQRKYTVEPLQTWFKIQPNLLPQISQLN